jgi:hypothetical protein
MAKLEGVLVDGLTLPMVLAGVLLLIVGQVVLGSLLGRLLRGRS